MEEARGVTAADGTTKARIERAALSLFAARGIDAVTTREIAAGSGVSEGAIYRHYSGKEALALALFLAIHKRLSDEVRDAAARHRNIEDQARAVVDAYCQIADDDWALFSYHLMTTHRFLPSPEQPEISDEDSPVAAIEALIAEAAARGDIPPCDPPLKAAMALGVVLQTALHRYYGRIKETLSTHRTRLADAVIATLKA
ncbi:MAG: TetR/AcrR family transcriptional regulator [Hyphococcus sp.]